MGINREQILCLLFCLCSTFGFSQHSYRFCKLVEDLEFVETYPDTIFFGKKLHYIGTRSVYRLKNEKFVADSGEGIIYNRDGSIQREILYDDYGNYLNQKFYNKSGQLEAEEIVSEIDTPYSSMMDIINANGAGNYKSVFRYYKYDKGSSKKRLRKEEFENLSGNLYYKDVKVYKKDGSLKRQRESCELLEVDVNREYNFTKYEWTTIEDPGAFKLDLTVLKQDGTQYSGAINFHSGNKAIVREKYNDKWRNSPDHIYTYAGIIPHYELWNGHRSLDFVDEFPMHLSLYNLYLKLPSIKPRLGKKLTLIILLGSIEEDD